MNKLMISTVALAVGLGLATSAMALPVNTYNFIYTPKPGFPYIIKYAVTLNPAWDKGVSFPLQEGAPAATHLLNLDEQSSFEFTVYDVGTGKPMVATCTATVKNEAISYSRGECSAYFTVVTNGPQVYNLNFTDVPPPVL